MNRAIARVLIQSGVVEDPRRNYYVVPGNLANRGVSGSGVDALVANYSSPEPETPDLMDTHPRFGSAMVSSTASAHPFPDARFAASHLR
jgi:hypothetical protein